MRGLVFMFRPGVILALVVLSLFLTTAHGGTAQAPERRLAFLASDLHIPFWAVLRRGIEQRAHELGYRVDVYSAQNDAKRELEATVKAIRDKVDGIIVSPTDSSRAVTILHLAERAGIPVVIADIGTDGGEYVSFISSDNYDGSYRLGRLLVKALQERHWDKGSVGIIAIPQKRGNGKARTAGFMRALGEAGIKGGDIRQQVDFSYRETYAYTRQLIAADPDLRGIWLQGSDRYQAALDAIADSGRKGQVLLACFDVEPEFLRLIPRGVLVGASVQQPFLMGEKSVDAMHDYLHGTRPAKQILLPVLVVDGDNIDTESHLIRRNLLGISGE